MSSFDSGPLLAPTARRTILALAGVAALFFVRAEAGAGPRKVLVLRGTFRFLSDAPFEKIQGTAEGVRAHLVTDIGDVTRTTGKVTVSVARMNTGSPIRDEHLKGESWLDGATHPKLVFVVREVSGVEAGPRGDLFVARGTVRGDFTLRGLTRPLSSTFVLKLKGGRAKVELTFDVRLADFGIKGRDGIIGKKVGERIAITGRLTGRVSDEP